MTPSRLPTQRLIVAALVALLLSACGGQPVKQLNTDLAERNWGIRRSNIAAVQSFALKGRIAESGIAGGRGDIDWTQSGERLDLRISGPLGVGALAISGDPQGVEIRSKNGVIATREPESYMQERLGWSVPLGMLRYWVLGVPALTRRYDEAPRIVKLDEIGRAEKFEQTGWKVEYLEYQPVNSLSLPRKMTLSNGSRSFRLVIDEWSGTP
ncbi:MAG: lipoprotein insertase outer membrane protein LolB [Nevskia sp.]|nr:lipoprotein insertase outer membrane protein LolB [Nevskia sp.]